MNACPEPIELVLWHRRAVFVTIWRIDRAPPRWITLYAPGYPSHENDLIWVVTDEFGIELGRRRFHYILAVISPAAVLDSVSAHEVMEETNRRDAARRSRPRIPLQLRRDNEL